MLIRTVLLVGLVGCDAVFQLQDPTADAGADNDASTWCQPQLVFDDFDDDMLCGNWGYPGGVNRMMSQGDGQLVMQPNVTGGNGSCLTRTPVQFGPSGIFIEVSEVLPPAISYMFLQLTAGARTVAITYEQGQLTFKVDNVLIDMVPHSATTRWWRIRPNGAAVTADVSPDGREWFDIGTHPMPAPAEFIVDIQAGQFETSQVPVRAVFERFNVCP